MDIRVDGRGVSRDIVHVFGRIGTLTENKAAPDGASTPYAGGLAELDRSSTMDHRTFVRSEDRRLLALEFLQRAAADLAQATLTRLRYIHLARTHGATWRDIANALDMTETGVRTLYHRNRDIAGGDE